MVNDRSIIFGIAVSSTHQASEFETWSLLIWLFWALDSVVKKKEPQPEGKSQNKNDEQWLKHVKHDKTYIDQQIPHPPVSWLGYAVLPSWTSTFPAPDQRVKSQLSPVEFKQFQFPRGMRDIFIDSPLISYWFHTDFILISVLISYWFHTDFILSLDKSENLSLSAIVDFLKSDVESTHWSIIKHPILTSATLRHFGIASILFFFHKLVHGLQHQPASAGIGASEHRSHSSLDHFWRPCYHCR